MLFFFLEILDSTSKIQPSIPIKLHLDTKDFWTIFNFASSVFKIENFPVFFFYK